jgi:hypothetical protein
VPEPLTTQLLVEILKDLQAAFPNAKGIDVIRQAEVYRNGLTGLSGDGVRAAARNAIQEDQYFPKVSRLRAYAASYDKRAIVTYRGPEPEWGVCPICFRRVELLPYYRDTKEIDPATRKPKCDPTTGKPLQVYAGEREHLIHDRIRHHVYENAEQEGAA